jgi:hypothetical protein
VLQYESQQKGGAADADSVRIPPRPIEEKKSETPVEEPKETPVDEKEVATEVTTEVYKPTETITHQRSSVSTGSRSAKAHVGRKVSETASIRDFPTNLLAIAKAEFPTASNQTDALAAYIYVKSGKNVTISSKLRELVDSWDGDNTVANIEKRMSSLEKQVREIAKTLDTLNLLLAYIAFDRLGYRNENAASPRDVNLLESGVEDLMKRADEQADTKRKHDAVQEGRPYH